MMRRMRPALPLVRASAIHASAIRASAIRASAIRASAIRALATVVLVAGCSHAGRPCPPLRPFARRSPILAPSDRAGIAAVAAVGAHFEACGAGGAYLVSREGARELTEGELKALKDSLFAAGVDSAGLGAVGCPPSKRHLGVVLQVRENTVTPVALAERLEAAATQAGGDVAAWVEVQILSAPGPRCAPDDPACEPIPYEAACVEKTHYDPKGERVPVGVHGYGSPGACRYDGECIVGGCGNQCVSTSSVVGAATCEGYAHWQEVFCGCVQTKCVWFRTK
jgi:hypothetical protein